MKKILSLVLSVAMILSVAVFVVSADDVVLVKTIDELVAAIANNTGKTIRLENDIKVNAGYSYSLDDTCGDINVYKGEELVFSYVDGEVDGDIPADFTVISAPWAENLNGNTLDGNGFTISGLYLDSIVGLFNVIGENDTIKNIKFDDCVQIFVNSDIGGGFLGEALYGVVEDLVVDAISVRYVPEDFTGKATRNGGIIAGKWDATDVAGGTMKNTVRYGAIYVENYSAKKLIVGGLFSTIHRGGNTVLNCANYADITVFGENNGVGGAIGIIEGGAYHKTTKLHNIANYGAVKVSGGIAGGVVGKIDHWHATQGDDHVYTNLYNEGAVDGGNSIIGTINNGNTAMDITNYEIHAVGNSKLEKELAGPEGSISKVKTYSATALSTADAVAALNAKNAGVDGAATWSVVGDSAVMDVFKVSGSSDTEPTTPTEPTDKDDTPQTGDYGFVVWVALFAIAGASLLFVRKKATR